MHAHRVEQVRFLSKDIFELTLERGDVVFEPGEALVLSGPDAMARPYSIASGVAESVLRFLIRRMQGGALSPWLAGLRAGDPVGVSLPFGSFRPLASAADDAVLVATGVGIAPFLSALRSMPEGVGRPICLYGVRRMEEAVFLDLLRARTVLTPAVTREAAAPGWFQGRVTDLLPRLTLSAHQRFYLCGYDAMVDAVTDWLRDRGVASGQIQGEVFFSGGGCRI